MRVWPWIVMYTYSILPQEHNGMIESGWKIKFEFANFVKKLRNLGLLQEARVSSFGLVDVLYIYNARDWSKKNEKRYGFECKNIFSSIFIKSFQNLIFSSLYDLARNWHVLWASLVLKFDRNPTQLVLHLVFIFYLF